MHPDTAHIANHMKDFGLYTLGRAIYDATFSEMMKPYSHALSVTLAAHAGEILTKARIAEQHPLLIFETLPKPSPEVDQLDIRQLLDFGRTVPYRDLPDLLWASTGYRMKTKDQFLEFAKLRNAITHFAVPEGELADETLRYAFEVIDPLVGDFWKESVLPYAEYWDDVIVDEGYLKERLESIGLTISNRESKRRLDIN